MDVVHPSPELLQGSKSSSLTLNLSKSSIFSNLAIHKQMTWQIRQYFWTKEFYPKHGGDPVISLVP